MKSNVPPNKVTKVANQPVKDKRITWILYIIIIVFACILYGNTLSNKYAMDDLYAITGNKYTQQGFAGIPKLLSSDFFAGYYGDQHVLLTGGRYRPLSLITFAAEHELFGENPGMSHFINLALYALTGCLLFYFLNLLFGRKKEAKWYLSVPLVATLLFIAHPVHTEVVANIKGRDEIFSLLGSLVTGIFYLKYLDSGKYKYLIYCFICFFLACLSKESAFLFLLILPLTAYYFRDFHLKENAIALGAILLAGLLFFLIRWSVIGSLNTPPSTELLDNPFIQATFPQKYATILFTLVMYIKLLILPHPLTWDYYPYQISLMNWSNPTVILSLVVYLALIILAVAGIRKKAVFSYAIWVYLFSILLFSNILFQVGVFMAERFLYIPSLAFSLIIAWVLVVMVIPVSPKTGAGRTLMIGTLFIIMILFSFKTISRNTDWKDDFTLVTTDAETSVNSAKGSNLAGQWYAWAANQPANAANKEVYMQKAYTLVKRATTIYPGYQDAWFRLGNIIFDYKHDADSTIACYLKILDKNPNEESVFKNLTMVINSIENNQRKVSLWEKILKVSPNRYEPNFYLANFYFDVNPPKSIAFAEKARQIRPNDAPNLKVLASGYLNQREFKTALPVYNEYLKINPTDTYMIKTRDNLEKYLKNPF